MPIGSTISDAEMLCYLHVLYCTVLYYLGMNAVFEYYK